MYDRVWKLRKFTLKFCFSQLFQYYKKIQIRANFTLLCVWESDQRLTILNFKTKKKRFTTRTTILENKNIFVGFLFCRLKRKKKEKKIFEFPRYNCDLNDYKLMKTWNSFKIKHCWFKEEEKNEELRKEKN